MNIPVVVLLVGLLVFSSFYFNRFFTRIHVPSSLFFIIVGLVLGFYFDYNKYFGQVGGAFSALTLNVIIYMVGRRFTFKNIREVSAKAMPLTIVNILFNIVIITSVARFVGAISWEASLFLGFVLGGTSSVIIVPFARALKMSDKSRKTIVYESLLTDIICLIGGLIFFNYIEFSASNINNVSVVGGVVKSVLLGVFSGLMAGILWVLVLISMKSVKNTMFASIAFILMLYGASELLGFNGGFAVLMFGMMTGNINEKPFANWFPKHMTDNAREYSFNEKMFFDEIIILIQTYFFVYMGMQLQFSFDCLVFIVALLIMVTVVLLRWISANMFVSKGVNYKERLIMSVLTPKGIIPAVMVTFAYEKGVADGLNIMTYGYAVIIISLFVSSVLIAIAKKDPMYFNRVSLKLWKRKNA